MTFILANGPSGPDRQWNVPDEYHHTPEQAQAWIAGFEAARGASAAAADELIRTLDAMQARGEALNAECEQQYAKMVTATRVMRWMSIVLLLTALAYAAAAWGHFH